MRNLDTSNTAAINLPNTNKGQQHPHLNLSLNGRKKCRHLNFAETQSRTEYVSDYSHKPYIAKGTNACFNPTNQPWPAYSQSMTSGIFTRLWACSFFSTTSTASAWSSTMARPFPIMNRCGSQRCVCLPMERSRGPPYCCRSQPLATLTRQ